MSGEGNPTAISGSPSSNTTMTGATSPESKQQEVSQQPPEDINDDSDFVLVKSRGKKHTPDSNYNKAHHQYHKPIRHQSHHNDGGGGTVVNGVSDDEDKHYRRRRFRDHYQNNNHHRSSKRDNSTGSKHCSGRGGGGRNNSKRGDRDNCSKQQNQLNQSASSSASSTSSNDKENNGVDSGGLTGSIPSVSTEQTNKTGSSLSSAVNSPPNPNPHPPIKTFSLVVAAGTGSSNIGTSSSTLSNGSLSPQQQRPPGNWVTIHQLPKPTMCPLPSTKPLAQQNSNVNDHAQPDDHFPLMAKVEPTAVLVEVVGEAAGASISSSSVVTEQSGSSIPDTSSLTSEDTVESCSGNCSKSSDHQVEFVEAPVPKVNPWLANRNAAQVIVGSSTTITSGKSFPAIVDESFPKTLAGSSKKPAVDDVVTPMQQQHPANSKKQTGTGTQEEDVNKRSKPIAVSAHKLAGVRPNNVIIPPPSRQQVKPTSFAQATSSSPTTAMSSTQTLQPMEIKSSATSKTSQTQKHVSSVDYQKQQISSNQLQPVYVREMTNGFRPGRGRGSYSASAAAGKKIPSRTQVLMKVINNGGGQRSLQPNCDDWPTLGEAKANERIVASHPQQQQPSLIRAKSVGSDDYVDEESNTPAPVGGDVVDSAISQSASDSAMTETTPETVKAGKEPNVSRTSSRSSNEEQVSDNDDLQSTPKTNDNGCGNGKKSKTKWAPLSVIVPTATGSLEGKSNGGGKYSNGAGSGRGGNRKFQGHSSSGSQSHHHQQYQNQQHHHSQNNYYSGQNYYQHPHHHHGAYSGGGGGRGKGKNYLMNGHYDYLDFERHSRNQSSRGMRGGSRNSRSQQHHQHNGYNPRHRQNGGGMHPPRSGSSLSLNSSTALMNGHYGPPPTHVNGPHIELLSPTGSGGVHGPENGYYEYPSLTAMFPANIEFIMPYVSTGYFPTPYLPTQSAAGAGIVQADGNSSNNSSLTGANGEMEHQEQPNKDPFDLLTEKVRTQIEYYFSPENLEKDFFLRRKMDDYGYLPIHVLATFPRVKRMTDEFAIIMSAIQLSGMLELHDDKSSVRTRQEPLRWPIPDSGNTILQLQENNSTAPLSSADSYYSSSTSQSLINNNNQASSAAITTFLGDTLNPNVPEFVPKSKIVA